MKLSSQFMVPSTPEHVFQLFLDADVMRSCIPGCEELVKVDEMTFRGRLVNVVAHVRFDASFSAEVETIDAPHRVEVLLKGEDIRLGSSTQIEAVLSVQHADAGSLVDYDMDVALWGKIGRLGESIVRQRTAAVQEQFVERFTAAAAGDRYAAPATVTLPPTARSVDERQAHGMRDAANWWRWILAWCRRLVGRSC